MQIYYEEVMQNDQVSKNFVAACHVAESTDKWIATVLKGAKIRSKPVEPKKFQKTLKWSVLNFLIFSYKSIDVPYEQRR